VLHAIQFKAQATLDCMLAAGVSPTVPSDKLYDTAIACAHNADPDYHSNMELWKMQGNP